MASPTTPSNQKGWHPQEQDHRSKERNFWRTSNIISSLAAIGGTLSTIFAVLALINSQDAATSSRKAADEARIQNDLTRKNNIVSQRAFVFLMARR